MIKFRKKLHCPEIRNELIHDSDILLGWNRVGRVRVKLSLENASCKIIHSMQKIQYRICLWSIISVWKNYLCFFIFMRKCWIILYYLWLAILPSLNRTRVTVRHIIIRIGIYIINLTLSQYIIHNHRYKQEHFEGNRVTPSSTAKYWAYSNNSHSKTSKKISG